MADIVGSAVTSAQGFLGLNTENVTIDNLTFKLFYKVTTTLLLLCTALTSMKQFFGDPIACEVVITFKRCRIYYHKCYKSSNLYFRLNYLIISLSIQATFSF